MKSKLTITKLYQDSLWDQWIKAKFSSTEMSNVSEMVNKWIELENK